MVRACLRPNGPIVPNWAPRPILQIMVQFDWEPGPTEIVPNWAPRLLRPALAVVQTNTNRMTAGQTGKDEPRQAC